MLDVHVTFFHGKRVAFYFVRWPDKQLEIFRHFTLDCSTNIYKNSFRNNVLIELPAKTVATYIYIYRKQVIIVPIN